MKSPALRLLFLALLVLALAACGSRVSPSATSPDGTQKAPSQSPIDATASSSPLPTTPPLAALVNGQGIWLEDYQASLSRLQDSQSSSTQTLSAAQQKQMALDDLVNEMLLAQAAEKAGHTVSKADVQQHLADLQAQLPQGSSLESWMAANHFNQEGLQRALKRSMEASWQRDQISQAVPQSAEQVHARQILLNSQQEAGAVYAQLQAGASFDQLAWQYDPLTGGDLGWFPRGYLTQRAVEDAAFALQPGQYSQPVQSDLGFHVVEVVARDAQHPLSADARLTLQHQALQDWLKTQRAQAKLQVFVQID
jgi:peptidyl-prolyl cis-trans isomerase C